MRELVGDPSASFYYDGSSSGCETAKGASGTPFCLAVMYGHPDNCSLGTRSNLHLQWAKRRCLKNYLRPLKMILDSFNRHGNLPRRWTICDPPCADEDTRRDTKVMVQYLAVALFSWFSRVLTLLDCKLKGQDASMLMTPHPLVSEDAIPKAVWDWAKTEVGRFKSTRDAGLQHACALLSSYMSANQDPALAPQPPLGRESGNPGGRERSETADGPDGDVTSGDSDDPGRWDFSTGGGGPRPTNSASASDEEESSSEGPAEHEHWSDDTDDQVQDASSGEEAEKRARPDLPHYPRTCAQDITAIAGVDLAQLYLTDIRMITAVPNCLWEAWARANTTVYRWIQKEEPGTQRHDCALMWELLLHKLLLRSSPKSRGKRRHKRDSLTTRFKSFEDGDYQSLIKGLEDAVRAAAAKPRRHVPHTEDDVLRRVEKLLMKGRFSKAYRLLDSKGQGDMRDPRVVSQLDVKHGPRVHAMPGHLPPDLPDEVRLKPSKLERVYHQLKPLSGTGPAGYRNEYLSCLSAFMYDSEANSAVKHHCAFAELFVNAKLPAWYYWIMCATSMIALVKREAAEPGGVPDVRPIGMGSCKRRAWTSLLMQDNADIFRETFWPVNVACGVKAGVAKLAFGVTEHMDAHPNHVLLKLDFTNAFNTVWRKAILKACYENEKWRHLYRCLWATLSPMALIKGINALSREGVQQGDPFGPAAFCMPLNPVAKWAHGELKKVGGIASFDMDDGYLAGPYRT